MSTTDRALALARDQLETYLKRFTTRLKQTNVVRLRQALRVLDGLLAVCSSFGSPAPPSSSGGGGRGGKQEPEQQRLLDVQTLMAEMGRSVDQVNLLELARWLAESRLAVKVSGYAEKLMDDEIRRRTCPCLPLPPFPPPTRSFAALIPNTPPPPSPSTRPSILRDTTKELSSDPLRASRLSAAKHASVASFHTFTALLRALTAANKDGRVLISVASPSTTTAAEGVPQPTAAAAAMAKGQSATRTVAIKYLLLNPGEMFRDVVAETRSVILAGGTMEPVRHVALSLSPPSPTPLRPWSPPLHYES